MNKLTASLVLAALLLSCGGNAVQEKGRPGSSVVKKTVISLRKETPNPFAEADLSPMDMSYCPADYPLIRHAVGDIPNARIIYSRPQKQGRTIFGNVVHYDTIWRLGANEGTEIEFFKPATIQAKKIKPGRYTLYCIPRRHSWDIVMNSEANIWGLNIDTAKDVAKFTVPVTDTTALSEFFTAIFEPASGGTNLLFAWDSVVVRLPISF